MRVPVSQRSPFSDSQTNPLFIVGPSRSGTTLLAGCLNVSSALHVGSESHYFDDLRLRIADDMPEAERQRLCEAYFMALAHGVYGTDAALAWRPEDDTPDAKVPREALRREALARGGDGDAYFEAFCRVQADIAGKPVWGEKTPRHVFRIPEIAARYPQARFLCMTRDPRAVVASYRGFAGTIHREDISRSEKFDEFADADRKRIERSYHPAIAALLWKGAIQAGLAAQVSLGAERLRIVRYEDLTGDPEPTLRGIAEWLDIPFEMRMITDVPQVNSSHAGGAAQTGDGLAPGSESGIVAKSEARWRTTLPPAEIAVVEQVCKAAMRRLDYAPAGVDAGGASVALQWMRFPFVGLRAFVANRGRIVGGFQYVAQRLRLGLGLRG